MKTQTLPCVVAISSLVFTLSAQAHDPKEHMKDAEKPDCAAMTNMDQMEAGTSEPVTQAIMKKCANGMHESDQEAENADDKRGESEGDATGEESSDHKH